jgi:hypothetical protein
MIECRNIERDMLVFPQRPILPKASCPNTVFIGPQGNGVPQQNSSTTENVLQ